MPELSQSLIYSVFEVHILHAVPSRVMGIDHFFTLLLSPTFSSKLLTPIVQDMMLAFLKFCQKLPMEGFHVTARIPFPPPIVFKWFIDCTSMKRLELFRHATRNYKEVHTFKDNVNYTTAATG